MTAPDLQKKNRRIAVYCVATVAFMVAGAFASAPLYDMFCRVTGFAGTPLRATHAPGAAAPGADGEQLITVRFNSTVAPGMPWKFQPVQREIKVRPGEEMLAFYQATNPTARTVMGTASFNVTPEKAGQYFNKIACFCFTEQELGPRPERRHAGVVLRRSRDAEGSEDPRRRRDHLELYLLPQGRSHPRIRPWRQRPAGQLRVRKRGIHGQ